MPRAAWAEEQGWCTSTSGWECAPDGMSTPCRGPGQGKEPWLQGCPSCPSPGPQGSLPCLTWADLAAPGPGVARESSERCWQGEPTHGTQSCSWPRVWQGAAPSLPKLQPGLIPAKIQQKAVLGMSLYSC